MTRGAIHAGIEMHLVIEVNKTRDLVHPDPGHWLVRVDVRFQILDSGSVFGDLHVARHTALAGWDGHDFAGGREFMAVNALQMSLRGVLLVAEGYRLPN